MWMLKSENKKILVHNLLSWWHHTHTGRWTSSGTSVAVFVVVFVLLPMWSWTAANIVNIDVFMINMHMESWLTWPRSSAFHHHTKNGHPCCLCIPTCTWTHLRRIWGACEGRTLPPVHALKMTGLYSLLCKSGTNLKMTNPNQWFLGSVTRGTWCRRYDLSHRGITKNNDV